MTYNSSHCVEQCLTSIGEQLEPAEVIVVDNASNDDSVEVVRRIVPDAVVIEPGTNVGFGRACNLGAAQARSETLMFVNPDVVISRVNRRDLEIAIGQPRLGLLVPLLSRSAETRAEHQIFPYRWWLWAVLEQSWSQLRPRELAHRPRHARSARNAWAAGALLLVRRDEFLALGGFDPRYFLYAEDLDLSRRYHDRGLGVHLTDAVVGRHSGSASSSPGDSLRVAPQAWSFLGTIEYLSRWEGDDVAARAAGVLLGTLRFQCRLLRGLKRVPGLGARSTRKAEQISAIEAFLLAHARSADAGAGPSSYCPGARVALRSNLGQEQLTNA